jgi:ribosomal protein S18 acetylase RimI-like enzyme
MTPKIRPFKPQDADKLAALWDESWRSTGVQLSSQASLAQLRHRVSLELRDGWDVTVAEGEGDLLGFVALKLANHCLDQLFIAPHAKRLGLGRELFGIAKQAMPQGFWLRSAAENKEARAFYEAVGMTLVRIEPHPRHGHRTAIYAIGDLGLAGR